MAQDSHDQGIINNAFYEELQDGWYTAEDHPIALLRAENAVRAPWVNDEINKRFNAQVTVLDVGCGGGFLSNHLAGQGHFTTGIDLSKSSLRVAKKYDKTASVTYIYADAYQLPFNDDSFDVVCAMDILEHVEEPSRLIKEASRVLKPGGLFFFHTFNRTMLSHLVVIKGVDWLVPNAPKNMHVYELFVKPEELTAFCLQEHLSIESLLGFMPDIWERSFWKSLFSRKVDKNLTFKFGSSLGMGYCGFAVKQSPSTVH